jgi:hypothetical protein
MLFRIDTKKQQYGLKQTHTPFQYKNLINKIQAEEDKQE